MNGWIKLHRKVTEWEWYTDRNTLAVFLHLLIMANIEDKKYRGYDVKRGECIIGRKSLAEDLNMSEQNVRTAINHLLLTNEITIKTTNQFTIVTICNYNSYQVNEIPTDQRSNQQPNQQLTNDQPTGNQQLTTPKEYIEYKKERNEEERVCNAPATLEEVESHCVYLGLSNYTDGTTKSPARLTAEKFYDHFNSVGWVDINNRKIVDWRSRLANWIRDDFQNSLKQRKKSGQEYSDEQQDALIEILTHKTK